MNETLATSKTNMLDIGVLTQSEACTLADILKLGDFSLTEEKQGIIDRFEQAGIHLKIEGVRTLYSHVKIENTVKRVHYNSFDKYLKDENIILSQLHYNLFREVWLAAKIN